MTSHAVHADHVYSRSSVVPAIIVGAVAGVVASLVMAMYAMFAALAAGTGFLTPLYHIASLLLPPDNMMMSMEAGMSGDAITFLAGPAVTGAIIHMMTGAAYGAIFGLIISRFRLRRRWQTLSGLIWGALVFLISAFVGLPLAALVFGSGDPISNMPAMAGWGTFFIEHLIFGLCVGVLYAFRPKRYVSHDH